MKFNTFYEKQINLNVAFGFYHSIFGILELLRSDTV